MTCGHQFAPTLPLLLVSLMAAALPAACGGGSGGAADLAAELAAADAGVGELAVGDAGDLPEAPELLAEAATELPTGPEVALTAGYDLDERTTLSLASDYVLPSAFFEALAAMGLELDRLTMPDIGLTADWDFSRLHWTDTIRHQGELAPELGYMVVEAVDQARADKDAAAELLAAQHLFNSRDQFIHSRYHVATTVSLEEEPLLAALQAFYESSPNPRHPAPPTAPWSEVAAGLAEPVLALPLDSRVALAQALLALLEAAKLRDEALMGKGVANWEEWQAQHAKFIKGGLPYDKSVLDVAHPGFDFELAARAGQVALRAVEELRLRLAGVAPVAGPPIELEGPLGRVIIDLSATGNTWKVPDAFLLVDRGGNDLYYGRTASNTAIHQPISVVLDLAGDDLYAPGTTWEPTAQNLTGLRLPMQGAGIFGIGLLVDGEGNDQYGCLTTGQGFGLFGVGALVDHQGDDIYRGYDYAQGSAEFGFGLLLDRDGTDRYETLQHSQGYGGPRGIGWLVDEHGDDDYLAIADPIIFDWAGEGTNFSGSQGFAFGWRGGPYWSGGLGALFDFEGSDSYQCAVMCMGFGYFFGTGLFYDRQGDDTYVNTHKYTMGSATHQSVGLFFDDQGSDSYTLTGDDEAIGLGYDHGVAYHLDRGTEDDLYTVENIGHFTLGFARHPAIGVLINEGGDDHYWVPPEGEITLGRSWVDAGDRPPQLSKIITLGLFLDLGGAGDLYEGFRPEVEDGATWVQDQPLGGGWDPLLDYGYGMDGK